jgi:hypothetical protein
MLVSLLQCLECYFSFTGLENENPQISLKHQIQEVKPLPGDPYPFYLGFLLRELCLSFLLKKMIKTNLFS